MKANLQVEAIQWHGNNHREVNDFIKKAPGVSMTGPHPEIGDKTESRVSLFVFSQRRYELKQNDYLVRTLDGSQCWVIPHAEAPGVLEWAH